MMHREDENNRVTTRSLPLCPVCVSLSVSRPALGRPTANANGTRGGCMSQRLPVRELPSLDQSGQMAVGQK